MKNTNLTKYIIIAGVLIIIALLIIILTKTSSGFSSTNIPLPISRYIDSPRSFAGNTYFVNASIDAQIAFSDQKGRILTIKSLETNDLLPIIAPKSVQNFNPQVGQKYKFLIYVNQDGHLVLNNSNKM